MTEEPPFELADTEKLKEAAELLRPTRPDLSHAIDRAIAEIEEFDPLRGPKR